MAETTIFYSPELRGFWPNPLAARWAESYPAIFEKDDLRITRRQPRNHFNEWLAAIYLFQRDGVLSLVEKYLYANHARKAELLPRRLTKTQREVLRRIQLEFDVQPPDLLVYTPDCSRLWFAEVKGPGDVLRLKQRQSHSAIADRLGLSVEVILVRPRSCPPAKPVR